MGLGKHKNGALSKRGGLMTSYGVRLRSSILVYALMAASALIGCSDLNIEVELAETMDMEASVDGAPFVLDASGEGDAASTNAPSASDTRATDTSMNEADLHDATPTDGTEFDLSVPDATEMDSAVGADIGVDQMIESACESYVLRLDSAIRHLISSDRVNVWSLVVG